MSGRRAVLLALLAALALGARIWWPGGARAAGAWLLGGRTEAAFGAVSEALADGQGIGEAVQAFCAEVDDGAA